MNFIPRLCSAVALFVGVATLVAQERSDSLGIGMTDVEKKQLTMPWGTVEYSNDSLKVSPVHSRLNARDIPLSLALDRPMSISPALRFSLYPKGSMLPHWTTGFVYGGHAQEGNFLSGYVTSANAGVYQSFGRYLQMQTGVSFRQYGAFFNTVIFDGSVVWRPNPHFGITVFGSYSPGSFISDFYLGQHFSWGGFVTLESDSHWGIDLGVTQEYDPGMGNQVTPIVRPYYNVNGTKLGFDFGPLIRSTYDKGRGGIESGNPIPQPQRVLPPVAPRR